MFTRYLTDGGMPYLSNLRYAEQPSRQYLQDLYNSVVLKDIVKRNSIRDVDLLERIIAYITANVGTTFSATAISKYLKCELEKRGAVVVMTREEDNFVGLYERPDIANASNAIISVSIHSNSMVDGNPFIKHGTSVFYYNAHAKNLAETADQAKSNQNLAFLAVNTAKHRH